MKKKKNKKKKKKKKKEKKKKNEKKVVKNAISRYGVPYKKIEKTKFENFFLKYIFF